MKILEEMWYGNVSPGERSMEKGSQLWKLCRLILHEYGGEVEHLGRCELNTSVAVN